MPAIFNSLGSNYSGKDARRLRRISGSATAQIELKEWLKAEFMGRPERVDLFYIAREALTAGLQRLALPPGSAVGITGFTCYVVEQSVVRAGLKPIFLDLRPGELNFGVDSLEKAEAKDERK